MARTRPDDGRKQRVLFSKRLAIAEQTTFEAPIATLDDIVFLPANLSRLVIDPYRDACSVATSLGSVALGMPLVVAGFDNAPPEAQHAAAAGARALGLASLGRRQLAADVPWLQLCVAGDEPSVAASGVIAVSRDGVPVLPVAARAGQLLGLASPAGSLRSALSLALDHGLDLVVLEGSPVLGHWPELAGPPELAAMRDAIAILRELNREEDVALLWHGGIRSGTDLAKLMGLRASAVCVGLALGLAVGGGIEGDDVVFTGGLEQASRDEQATMFLQALRAEASIMPRCTGKTDIRNLEPEDLRSITLATATATGLPLAGRGAAT